MKKSLLLLVVFLLGSIPSFAQLVDTAWVRRYNGPGNYDDQARDLAVDGSGNVYVTGGSWGSGKANKDYATIKYNSDGDTAWVRRYNGPGNSADEAHAIAVDSFGNSYVCGTSIGIGTSEDYAVIKYHPDGDTAWVRRYNGPGNDWDCAYAIAVDDSGNVCVTGGSGGSGILWGYATIKYYPNGDTAWVRRYDGPGSPDDYGAAIAVDHLGNVYVTGSSYDPETDYDYATVKYYPNGDTAWVRRYDGTGGLFIEGAYAISLDGSGNVYVTGKSSGIGSSIDYVTIKYHPDGDTAWVRRYNGPGNWYDMAKALVVDGSGNVYVSGRSEGSGTHYDYATIKYHSNGDTAWIRRYNGSDNDDVAYAIAVDGSGDVYVTGYSYPTGGEEDYATLKYDSSGNLLWVKRYNGPGNDDDLALAIALDNALNVYVTGSSWGSGTNRDYATIKYVQGEVFVQEHNEESTAKLFALSQNYPNPFNPVTSIQYTVKSPKGHSDKQNHPIHTNLTIYNILGQKVRTLVDEVELAGEHKVVWDGRDAKGNSVPSGVYFYKLRVGDSSEVKKMLLIK